MSSYLPFIRKKYPCHNTRKIFYVVLSACWGHFLTTTLCKEPLKMMLHVVVVQLYVSVVKGIWMVVVLGGRGSNRAMVPPKGPETMLGTPQTMTKFYILSKGLLYGKNQHLWTFWPSPNVIWPSLNVIWSLPIKNILLVRGATRIFSGGRGRAKLS